MLEGSCTDRIEQSNQSGSIEISLENDFNQFDSIIRFNSQDTISIVDGVYMEKSNATEIENTPDFADARVLGDLSGTDRELMSKINTFLRTHMLKVDLSEGRGGGGIGGSKGGVGGKNKIKRKFSFDIISSYLRNAPALYDSINFFIALFIC